MDKLTDTQAILLSTAAQREGRSLLPLPTTIAPEGTAKAIAALLKRKLAEERETSDAAAVHRADGDIRYGVFATSVGLAAIGIAPEPDVDIPHQAVISAPKPVRVNKTEAVLELLRRGQGATLAELVDATGWLPHTTRAALTGLRKKSHAIERTKRGDETCYRIAAA